MKKLFTQSLLSIFTLCLVSGMLIAQIPEESPFPVDVEFEAPGYSLTLVGPDDYSTMVDFGVNLEETVSGQLAWAFDETGDSLMCNPTMQDLSGNIALIRRGACNFSLKIWHAQEAGAVGAIIVNNLPNDDGGGLVGMLGGDSAALVTIPAVFMTLDDAIPVVERLDNGEDITTTFRVKSFYNAISSYLYHTPISQVVPIDVFRINYFNRDTMNTVNVNVNVAIEDPSGDVTNLTGSAEVGPLGDSIVLIEDSYLPEELGEYTVTYTNDLNEESVEGKFEITEFTWAPDNGDISRGVGPSDDNFVNTYNLTYLIGTLVLTGETEAKVTHASFGLSNPADLVSGNPEDDLFALILYKADADGDDVIDLENSFEDLEAVALGAYSLDGDNLPDPLELVTVPLESLDGEDIILDPDDAYYITLQYDGLNSGLGVAPQFAGSPNVNYLNFPTTPLFLDQLYSGWSGNQVAVRLHLEGFVTGLNDEPLLDESQVSLSPNPATDFVDLAFDLESGADKVFLSLFDNDGRLIRVQRLQNIQKENFRMDVSKLVNGHYLLNVKTPEGFRTLQFVIVK